MQPGSLSPLQAHLLFSESAETHSAMGWQVKCNGLETLKCEQEHSQATALHPLEHCPAPPSSTVPGPHPASSRAAPQPLGASGNRWPSVLGSIRPQTPGLFFVVVVLSNHQKLLLFPEWQSSSKNKVERDAPGSPGCFYTFAKVPSPLCKVPQCTAQTVQV